MTTTQHHPAVLSDLHLASYPPLASKWELIDLLAHRGRHEDVELARRLESSNCHLWCDAPAGPAVRPRPSYMPPPVPPRVPGVVDAKSLRNGVEVPEKDPHERDR